MQMHLDPPFHPVPARLVPEAAQIKIRSQFPVDARQQIQIECRRNARGIVVSQQLQFDALLQVRAEQQCVPRSEKSVELQLLAYDDPAGVTAAFNLNLLARINRELG